MKNNRFFALLALQPLFIGCFGGCDVYQAASSGANYLSIMSWNVQALFDGHDDGFEYEEYRDGSGWNTEKYTARLNRIAQGINAIGEHSPDVIAFIEVENRAVLEKLNSDFLSKERYKALYFAGNAGYSLGIGVLSKIPFEKTILHSINVDGEVIPRPVVEIWFEHGGQRLVLFVCHWKSKLGGEEATEKLRREAAKIVIRRQRELAAQFLNMPVVVAGDLNENYDEFYRCSAARICAIMPDDPEAARRSGYTLPEQEDENAAADLETLPERLPQDFFIVSNEKPPVSAFFDSQEGIFYSPWGNELQGGSYFYDGGWETIDHFFLNGAFFDKTGIEFDSCFIVDCEPFVNSKGEPDRYNPRTGAGLSDHLPLVLRLSL
ncbi:MAG: endonuclease/exonuclease/phosphatase family protein [Spirochaetaceae bacterium]|jgi:endonuclease/exonuclease/phosphatase family metal-dependent hydrolase|nr:endonuclease/exonuclease/phosphatase family protein [Spirochaetaceae bacterium]GMO30091.1 MAG: endonuclease/exonuclease/phosphatase family protein [Termitinemataceae bacterium]